MAIPVIWAGQDHDKPGAEFTGFLSSRHELRIQTGNEKMSINKKQLVVNIGSC
jgi:hypothetical protein